MKYPLFLLKELFQESKKNNFLAKSFLVAFLYIVASILIVNYKSFLSFGMSEYSIFPKLKILILIFFGSFQALTTRDTILLLLTAALFGTNVELVLRKIKFLASYGNLHVTIGTGLISIAATGCASCGLSIASIVGLGGTLALLPFHGLELYIVSIIVLTVSLFYNLQTLVKVCKIK